MDQIEKDCDKISHIILACLCVLAAFFSAVTIAAQVVHWWRG